MAPLSGTPRLALLLTAALTVMGQTGDPYEALRAKDYDHAIQLFQNAIVLTPDRSSIRKDLAYTLLKIGETEAARDQFAEAMRLDPQDEHVALEYAFLCYETKQRVIARRVFDRIRQTGNATAAQAFENIDRPLREGIARWTRVVTQSPENFSAHEELAHLAEQSDESSLAAEHYQNAWRLRPARRDLLLDLGRVWKEQNREAEANAALLAASRGAEPRVAEEAQDLLPKRYPYVYEFQDALKLDPSNVELRRELAYLHLAMGNRGDAEKEFQAIGEHAPKTPAGAKQLGAKSLEQGYLKDAVKYLQAAHEDDPVDFDVMLKLGWAYNVLKEDEEAARWFNLARHSPNRVTAAEASRAYHNLEGALRRFRTTVWAFPMFSSRWHDVFAYAQAKTELRMPHWWVRPYASIRVIGDSRGAVELAGTMGPQYLSERSAIVGVGLATIPWHGTTGWFEAGESIAYFGPVTPDYRGGLAFAKGFGKLLARGAHGGFAETNDDGVFVSRFSKDTLFYSQNRIGYTFRETETHGAFHAQLYWNWNATVDALGQYWANYVETGPGLRFRFEGMPSSLLFSVNAVRGFYLVNEGNPRGSSFNDVRVGIWYAVSK